MTNWGEIAATWAAWVNKTGAPVQCRNPDTVWMEYCGDSRIDRADFAEWRIKPEPKRVRMYLTIHGVCVARMSRDGKVDCGVDRQWIGDWQEVPE